MNNSKILDAFPIAIRQDVAIVLDFLKDKRLGTYTNLQQEIVVMGEVLVIPYRIDVEMVDGKSLSEVQQNILHCLYLRHHDGFIRQKSLEKLIIKTDSFIVPFLNALNALC